MYRALRRPARRPAPTRRTLAKPPPPCQLPPMDPAPHGPATATSAGANRACGARLRPPETSATGPRDALQDAFAALARALGDVSSTALDEGVAARCSALWREHLLWGDATPLAARLGPGLTHGGGEPVVLRGVGVHLVCPHHLTVALGKASLAYLPAGRLAGLGALAEVLEASCARLVLQEDAAADAARAVVMGLGARACVVRIEARHPCHALTRPRSHAARVSCDGSAGEAAGVAELRPHLNLARRP